jgi:hypothetical protein
MLKISIFAFLVMAEGCVFSVGRAVRAPQRFRILLRCGLLVPFRYASCFRSLTSRHFLCRRSPQCCSPLYWRSPACGSPCGKEVRHFYWVDEILIRRME